MTDERRKTVARLFDLALDLAPAERTALLARECRGDAALRAEVEALLAADTGAAAAALEDLTPQRSVELQPGELVADRYRVVRLLGEGGMGAVYEAEQLQPQRRVALKCLRAGLASPASLRRFAREAELLGRLRHPGIAQILEAGVASGSSGQPFFAMEFVQGAPLLDHARGLPQPEQLELFAQVCDAVQSAHALGIVHRDLKPANVLVDTSSAPPCVKVLDFGVARALADEADGTLLTRTHEIVGTLAYLSPEQMAAGSSAVDARADVWSLGVTLFSLLAGRLPFELTGCTLPQAARMLQDEEPARIDRLVPALRGDVATIVHKALAKEPQRRYATAGELAADLRRHLRSEPIAARPSSALYQFSRFARRHRAMVSGLVGTILALAAGLAVSLHFLAGERQQRSLAERRAGEVRALARDLIFDVEEQLAKLDGATQVRRHVVATGLRYAEGLLSDAGDDPQLLLDVGLAFRKLAGVLGDPSRPNLGDIPAAEAALDKAIAALRRAADRADDPSGALDGLFGAHNMQAELHRSQNRAAQRLVAMQAARDVAAQLAARGDEEGGALALAGAAANLGRLQFDQGQFAAAIDNFEIYLASQKRRIGTEDPVAARNAALILGFIADCRRNVGDPDGCRAALEEGLTIAETFHREHPDDAGARRSVVAALRSLAIDGARAQRHADALPLLQRARTLLEAAPPDPADISSLREQAIVDYDLASALIELDRTDEAAPHLAAYRQRVAALLQKSPENRNRARDVMLGHQLAAKLFGCTGDVRAMQESLAQALERCRAAAAADQSSVLPWEDLAKTQRIGARACAQLAEAATGEAKAQLQLQVVEGLEAEAATLATMVERRFGQAWIARGQAVAAMLAALRAGEPVTWDK